MNPEIQRFALRDIIHRKILEQILHGNFPPGSRVKDTELSEKLQVSRTPVREALLRLVNEGFLDNQVGRGFVVRPLTETEVKELYPIIGCLETLALKSSEQLPQNIFETLESISKEMEIPDQDLIRLIELDKKWHTTILSGCNNQRLLDMISELKTLAFRYEYAYMQNHHLVESSIKEHRNIAHSLQEKGLTSTVKLIEKHWSFSMNALLDKLQQIKKNVYKEK